MTVHQIYTPASTTPDVALLAGIIAHNAVTEWERLQAQALWKQAQHSWNRLYQFTDDELTRIVGEAASRRLQFAFDLGRRKTGELLRTTSISSPRDVVELLQLEMGHLDTEHLRVVLLNTKNHILDIETISVGTLNTANVRIAEVFRTAIRRNSASLILVHNHPSSDPTPSAGDIAITKQIVQAGQLFEIEILDHLIICATRWVSMREQRLGW